jgi:hypothetical protein
MVHAQAEKLQRQAISTLRKGGAGGRALARGYSGLADIVYQLSSRRAPEALQHLRTAVAVRVWRRLFIGSRQGQGWLQAYCGAACKLY